MIDIVFPSGNETEFIGDAKKLGIKGLIFVYSDKSLFFKGKSEIEMVNALLCEPMRISRARDSGIFSICHASREAIERGANIVFGFETLFEKDKTHYRESGINQVLATLAFEKNVRIGFAFSEILSANPQSRSVLIGRMMQNIRLCRKYKTPLRIASFAKQPSQMRAPSDLASFFISIGMHPFDVKKALE